MTPGIEPYDPAWASRGQELAAAVQQALQALDYRSATSPAVVEHIGSTSVRGLGAKPFLDLQAALLPLPDDDALNAVLSPLGFQREQGARPDSPGVNRDTPRWAPAAPEVWRKSLFTTGDLLTPGTAILHVRRSDSPWAQWAVAFRDWLRTHTEERDRYVAIKSQLMEANTRTADFDDYTRAKSVYFDEVEPRVRAWARQNGAGS